MTHNELLMGWPCIKKNIFSIFFQISAYACSERPDVGPKFFSGHGSAQNPDPTRLHTDIGDAANICVDTQDCTDEELHELTRMAGYNINTTNFDAKKKPAALWHIFHRDSYSDIVE